jgi:hypothetical protein
MMVKQAKTTLRREQWDSITQPDNHTRFFQFGRQALYAALKAININKGDLILIPSLICREVLAAIYSIGATPIYYEVNTNLKPLDLPINKKIKAVLAINYFGFAQDLNIFNKYAIDNSCILIEDNAHGFLSADAMGVPLGTRGDIGIFSFRKSINLPNCGSLIFNKKTLMHAKIDGQIPFDYNSVSLSIQFKRLLSILEDNYGIKLTRNLKSLRRGVREIISGHKITPASPESEFKLPENQSPNLNVFGILKKLDLKGEIFRRRRLYRRCMSILGESLVNPVFADLPENTTPYGFAFYMKPDKMEATVDAINKLGLDFYRWPDLPSDVENNALDYYKNLWLVNFLN